jgi:hypothetical protein
MTLTVRTRSSEFRQATRRTNRVTVRAAWLSIYDSDSSSTPRYRSKDTSKIDWAIDVF